MKKTPLAALILGALLAPCISADSIYQSDSAGNVNQVNIGVGKSRQFSSDQLIAADQSEVIEREVTLRSFSRLRVEVPAEVIYQQGPKSSVVMRGRAGALDNIEIKQRTGTTVIKSKNNFHTDKGLELLISGGALERLELAGAIDAELKRIKSSRLKITMEGAVDLVAQGRVDQCTVHIFGSGDVDLERLKCNSTDVKLEGSADLHVFAGKQITGSAAGAADVTVSGNPAVRELVGRGAVDIYYD